MSEKAQELLELGRLEELERSNSLTNASDRNRLEELSTKLNRKPGRKSDDSGTPAKKRTTKKAPAKPAAKKTTNRKAK